MGMILKKVVHIYMVEREGVEEDLMVHEYGSLGGTLNNLEDNLLAILNEYNAEIDYEVEISSLFVEDEPRNPMNIRREIDVNLSSSPKRCTNCEDKIRKYDAFLKATVADDHHKVLYTVCSIECEKEIEEDDE